MADADLLLRGGMVMDGTGTGSFRADVAVRGGRIVEVGEFRGIRANQVVDVTGLTVVPGFIDMHAHSDIAVLSDPLHEAKVRQGVTLEVVGQDGLSYAPTSDETLQSLRVQLRGWNGDPSWLDWNWRSVAEYLDRMDRGTAVNVAYLVPHGTVRMLVLGEEDRRPRANELARMQEAVAQGMEDGAFGLSAGLSYPPGMYADDDELAALCEVVASHGGYYCPHHRNYGSLAMDSYRDCIDIARRSGVPVHLTHAHLGFDCNKGRGPELLELVDRANAEGLDVSLDSYPYLAGSTYLHAVLPGWFQAGGQQGILRRLQDPTLRERLRVELEVTGSDGFHGVPISWDKIVVSGVVRDESVGLIGQSMAQAAAAASSRPVDFLCSFLVGEELGATCLELVGNEENVRTIMTHPRHMVGSDGILVGGRPHPRAWGTFPRYLARYARDLGILTIEQAVAKMTSVPARRLGLADRGVVRAGNWADLVCLDLATVRDCATYEVPRQYPVGISWVIVNGVPVIAGGSHTGRTPGHSIRRPGSTSATCLKDKGPA